MTSNRRDTPDEGCDVAPITDWSDTKALLATVRRLFDFDFHATQHIAGLQHDGHDLRALHVEDVDAIIAAQEAARPALDAIASELETAHENLKAYQRTLLRVRAERDDYRDTSAAKGHALRDTQARLDRAVEALRVYVTPTHWAIGRDDLRDRQAVWIGPGAIGDLSGLPNPDGHRPRCPSRDRGVRVSYVGIDFDTHAVHLVKLEESGAAAYTRCELVGLDAFERTRQVRNAMPGSAFWDDVVAVAIEEPQGVQKATVAKLKAVQGAILACIPRSTLVEPMVPARWRTAVGLPGNASKDEVKEFVSDALVVNGWSVYRQPANYDFYDSWCLALAVSRLVEVEAA